MSVAVISQHFCTTVLKYWEEVWGSGFGCNRTKDLQSLQNSLIELKWCFVFQGAEDYQALLMEKETLLAELRSENLTKDAENRKLQRRIKRTDQELNDLNLEREKMEKELDEAQLQKSRSDKTINVIIPFFFPLFHKV